MDKFIFRTKNVSIELDIKFKTMVICGDSGSGKTFISNIIYSICKEPYSTEYESNVDIKDIVVIRNADDARFLDLSKIHKKVVILDRMNMYVTDKLINDINNGDNIVFAMYRGRTEGGLIVRMSSYIDLEYTKEGNKISIKSRRMI